MEGKINIKKIGENEYKNSTKWEMNPNACIY